MCLQIANSSAASKKAEAKTDFSQMWSFSGNMGKKRYLYSSQVNPNWRMLQEGILLINNNNNNRKTWESGYVSFLTSSALPALDSVFLCGDKDQIPGKATTGVEETSGEMTERELVGGYTGLESPGQRRREAEDSQNIKPRNYSCQYHRLINVHTCIHKQKQ